MTSDVGKLAAFIGYYAVKGATGVAPGAFLSVDTTEEYVAAAGIQKTTTIVINFSLDGKSLSGSYPFSGGDTFDGRTLNMPGKLTLHFTRQYHDGQVATFSGMIGDAHVSGGTYFNPAPLAAFIGDYYDPTTKKKALSISDKEMASPRRRGPSSAKTCRARPGTSRRCRRPARPKPTIPRCIPLVTVVPRSTRDRSFSPWYSPEV